MKFKLFKSPFKQAGGPAISHCSKCGVSFTLAPPLVKYAKDPDWGERLLWMCVRCGFRWGGPTEDQHTSPLSVPEPWPTRPVWVETNTSN